MPSIRRVIALAPLVAVAAALAPGAAKASATYDLRGVWDTVATGGGYSQTFTISSMNLATGAFSGTGDGTVFVLKGVETGGTVNYTQTLGGYVSHDSASVVEKNGKLQMVNGKWHDSNGSGGTFSAVIKSPAAGSSVKPVLATSVVAGAVSGSVLVKRPGATAFTRLSAAASIPVGSTVDATHGKVRLTTAGTGGHVYTGVFHSGEFVVSEGRDGLTNLTLSGGVACAAAAKGSTSTRAPSAKRSLWGYAHGNFKTTGHYGAATVLGTQWLTRDECTGTLVRVLTGEVRVRDLVRQRSVLVRAPRSYFVKA
jgi:hypothetical protein